VSSNVLLDCKPKLGAYRAFLILRHTPEIVGQAARQAELDEVVLSYTGVGSHGADCTPFVGISASIGLLYNTQIGYMARVYPAPLSRTRAKPFAMRLAA
jgi:hypothetical protein